MADRIIGDPITLDFTTHDPTTGNVIDADSLPTCEVFESTVDTPIMTPTVTKRTGKTGNYRVFFLATENNGFELEKSYNVIVEATVKEITAKARIGNFVLGLRRTSEVYDLMKAQKELLDYLYKKERKKMI